ncbi:MAG: hypothetical protein AB8B51_21555 [Sedimentitalea sp.]
MRQALGIDIVKIPFKIDARRHHKKINLIGVVRGVLRGDTRGETKRGRSAVFAEYLDFTDICCVTCGNTGRDHNIHVTGRDARTFGVMRGVNIALFFERCAADVQTVPTARRSNCSDFICFGLVILGPAFIYACVIRPIAVNLNTVRLQIAQNRKGEFASDSQKIDPNPNVRKRLAHLFDDRDQFFFFKIVIDQKDTGTAAGYRCLDVSFCLFAVKHMNDGKDNGT